MAVRPDLDLAADGQEQLLGSCGDLGNRGIEGGGVASGWHPVAAELPHVLAGRGLDLAGGRWDLGIAEGSDGSAHGASVPAGLIIPRCWVGTL